MQTIIHQKIKELREKPDHIKRHILHVTTLTFGVILVFLWVYSLGKTVADPDIQAKTLEDLKPLSSLKANLIGGYESISE